MVFGLRPSFLEPPQTRLIILDWDDTLGAQCASDPQLREAFTHELPPRRAENLSQQAQNDTVLDRIGAVSPSS